MVSTPTASTPGQIKKDPQLYVLRPNYSFRWKEARTLPTHWHEFAIADEICPTTG